MCRISNPVLLLIGGVTLSKLFNLSVPQVF